MINIKCYGSGSRGNLYLISSEKTNIILECGFSKLSYPHKIVDNF